MTEEKMIANSFDEFVEKASDAIRIALNSEAGQKITRTMLEEALKKNPDMTPEEWKQMKSEFMTFCFLEFVKETPEAMREFSTHIYNKLREEPEDDAEALKKQYPAGTRVMIGASESVGTVLDADDAGLLLIQWDTGNTLDVIDAEECAIIQ